MEGTKKRKRTRSANNLVQKNMLRPCLQRLENYRGGNIWWRRTRGSCLVFQSSKQHPEGPQISGTQTHAHKPSSCGTSLVLNWTISRLLLLFLNSSEKEERVRNEIKEKDKIMTKGTKKRNRVGVKELSEGGAGSWIIPKKLWLASSPSSHPPLRPHPPPSPHSPFHDS